MLTDALYYSFLLVSFMFVTSFFFNAPAPTEIYTLSLHDALPICQSASTAAAGSSSGKTSRAQPSVANGETVHATERSSTTLDRKSTRLNSSHVEISYAVFCLKKKKKRKAHDIDKRNLRYN